MEGRSPISELNLARSNDILMKSLKLLGRKERTNEGIKERKERKKGWRKQGSKQARKQERNG